MEINPTEVAGMGLLSSVHGMVKRVSMGFQPRAVVLMYHRIAKEIDDPFNLCVSPENFNEQLEVLRKDYRVLRLEDILPLLREGNLPAKATAITFDDGYADNQQVAAVSLGRFGMPATVFVTSGYMDGRREYWWDELVRFVTESRSDPAEWRLGDPKLISPGAAGITREELLRQLQTFLREQTPDRRESILIRMADLAGLERMVRDSHKPMTANECAAMSKRGWMTVGAHTVHHVWLSAIDGAKQDFELRESKRTLEEITGSSVHTLAYPYGRRDSVSQKTLLRVREAGFTLACANERGLVKADANPFWIPRCIPHNVDGETFAKRMHAFFQDHSAVHAPCGRDV
jgi:peptidoglycan/xylan/chitin deacetylase (PgdA/CDA1 family)